MSKRFRVPAVDRRNKAVAFFASMPDGKTIDFTIGAGTDQFDIYINSTDLINAIYELKKGRPPVAGKHSAKETLNG